MSTSSCFAQQQSLPPPSSTPHPFIQLVAPSFRKVATILLSPIRTPAPKEWQVLVVFVDKFGLCWRGDFPPALTCASQVSWRIPSSTTTTTTNGLLSTISHISTTDLPSAAFLSFSTSSGTATSVGCHSSSHSIQITINQGNKTNVIN